MWPSKVCCACLFRGSVSSQSNIPALLTVSYSSKCQKNTHPLHPIAIYCIPATLVYHIYIKSHFYCKKQMAVKALLDQTRSPPSSLLLDTPTCPKKETHELRGTDLSSQPQHSSCNLLLTNTGLPQRPLALWFIMSLMHKENDPY